MRLFIFNTKTNQTVVAGKFFDYSDALIASGLDQEDVKDYQALLPNSLQAKALVQESGGKFPHIKKISILK